MKPIFRPRFFMFWVCVVCCLVFAQTSAQSQAPPAFLEIKTCGRELKVFEDGKVTTALDGKATERLLSASRMRKLRQVLESAPCPFLWRRPPQLPAQPDPAQIKLLPVAPECLGPMIVSGVMPAALQTVVVTHRSTEYEANVTVYIMRDVARRRDKEWVKRNYQTYIHPGWEKFFYGIADVIGGQNIFKGCKY